MQRYYMKEAFLLQSHQPSPRLFEPGQYYATEDEAEISELEKFVEAGSCKKVESEEPKKLKPTTSPSESNTKTPDDPSTNDNPEEDITIVKGVGNAAKEKLAALEKPVTTVSELKDRLAEPEVQEALGSNVEKVQEYFTQAE